MGLPDDAVVSPDASFLLSGGDSLQCMRLCDDVASSVGVAPAALLEVLLSGSFSDVVSHVTTALFPFENSEITEPTTKGLSNEMPLSRLATNDTAKLAFQEPPKRPSAESSSAQPAKRPSAENHSREPAKRPSTESPSAEPAKRPSVESPPPEPDKNPLAPCVSEEPPASRHCKFVMLRRAGEVVEMGASLPLLSSQRETLTSRKDLHLQTTERSDAGAPLLSLRVRWTSDTGRCVDASPVLLVTRNDHTTACSDLRKDQSLEKVMVYIGSHSHRFQAVDFSTGNLRWERVLGGRIESSAVVSRCGYFIAVGQYLLIYFSPYCFCRY